MRRFLRWAVVALVLLALGAALGDLGGSRSATPSASVDDRASALTPVSTPTPAVVTSGKTRRGPVRAIRTPTRRTSPAVATFTSCDANIRAKASNTTCLFAQNVFYEYYRETHGQASDVTVRAWSPAAARFYRVRCSGEMSILCRAGDGAAVKFSSVAVSAYDDEQAAAYASTHATGHPAPGGGDEGDAPTSGDVQPGDPGPPPDDPRGNEIPNYENGTGYRVRCADGMYSHSGGRPGACSRHGGVG